jgi:hypothetical protein
VTDVLEQRLVEKGHEATEETSICSLASHRDRVSVKAVSALQRARSSYSISTS